MPRYYFNLEKLFENQLYAKIMNSCFVPRVCWHPWTWGQYLLDKDGVLCCKTSGISIKLIQTGAWSEPSNLMLLPPFHLWVDKSQCYTLASILLRLSILNYNFFFMCTCMCTSACIRLWVTKYYQKGLLAIIGGFVT